jgi:tryptophan-rich sensory protein
VLYNKRLARDALKQGQMFVKHVVPAAIKPVHSLWHEVIGFVFMVFAIFAGLAGFRTFAHFQGETGDVVRMVLCGIFVIIMSAYGISSFLKARKISRS